MSATPESHASLVNRFLNETFAPRGDYAGRAREPARLVEDIDTLPPRQHLTASQVQGLLHAAALTDKSNLVEYVRVLVSGAYAAGEAAQMQRTIDLERRQRQITSATIRKAKKCTRCGTELSEMSNGLVCLLCEKVTAEMEEDRRVPGVDIEA